MIDHQVITSEFIKQCLDANELGDAMIYIALNRGERLFNQTSLEWMRWSGHYWEVDHCSADAMSAVEGVADQYIQEAKSLVDAITNEKNDDTKKRLIETQKSYYRRIDRLRSVRGVNNCVKMATQNSSRIVARTEDFDLDPWKLPLLNGVVDLKTGELHPGNPNDMLMMHCPHEWHGINAPCPLWEKAVKDIMADNDDMVSFIQRLFGYAITGLTSEHVFPVFWGRGRNGKSLLVETIRYVMGPMAAPVRSEMLLDQGYNNSSRGPTPDIMSLKGLRVAFASETGEGRKLDTDRVKHLTGGDSLNGRNPHDRYETKFDPTHTIFLLTNNKPAVPADDFATWKRIILIPFAVTFVADPRNQQEKAIDKDLGDKLKAEAPGILAWLVRGCLEWQLRGGLDFPALVNEATGEYRRSEDMIQDFIDECCLVDRDYSVMAADLYDCFKVWFERNISKKGMSQKRFGGLISKKFDKKKDSRRGVYVYSGIGLAEQIE